MSDLIEDTAGSKRHLPIADELKALLLKAAAASGVDTVRVISGGQCRKGTCTRRTGSVRHDNGMAADLQLLVGHERQRFTNDAGRKVFEDFVRACAAGGATGLGAGTGYMGPETIHVGYGKKCVWGAGGKSANAPEWLVAQVNAGWRGSRFAADLQTISPTDSDDDEIEENQVSPS